MSTTTTRLALIKPAANDAMNLGDNNLTANFNSIDTNAHAQSVALVSSIASPYKGKIAFETSGNENKLYVPPNWTFMGSENATRGLVGYEFDDTQNRTYGATEAEVFRVSFNATAGRKYLCSWLTHVKIPGTGLDGTPSFRFRWAVGTTITTSSTLIEQQDIYVNSLNGFGKDVRGTFEFNPNTTGLITVMMTASRGAPTTADIQINTSGAPTALEILDWGI